MREEVGLGPKMAIGISATGTMDKAAMVTKTADR